MIRRNGPWRSIEVVEFATLEWVHWFNNRRLLEPIGNIPPAEFEAMYVQSQTSPTRGADSHDGVSGKPGGSPFFPCSALMDTGAVTIT